VSIGSHFCYAAFGRRLIGHFSLEVGSTFLNAMVVSTPAYPPAA